MSFERVARGDDVHHFVILLFSVSPGFTGVVKSVPRLRGDSRARAGNRKQKGRDDQNGNVSMESFIWGDAALGCIRGHGGCKVEAPLQSYSQYI